MNTNQEQFDRRPGAEEALGPPIEPNVCAQFDRQHHLELAADRMIDQLKGTDDAQARF